MKYIIAFFAVVSVFSIVITVYDKLAAKSNSRRIPEKTLLLTGFFGGACAMFLTMITIRHKTRHMKFMVLLPLMSALHIALIIYFDYQQTIRF